MEARITYFDKPGKDNTDAVLEIVKERAEEMGIKTVVIASYRGYTAEKAVKILDGLKIIVVAGFLEPTTKNLSETFSQSDEEIIRSKATVLIATHLFSGISRAVRKKFSSSSPGEIIAQALRMVGVGIKVGIECAIMAADAGLVSTDEDVISIAGTRSGADTAIIIRPVNSQDIFELKVKEILCKPNDW
ncbi:pyruvate kinase alpha/beta domain-containing protein [Chloroflexota bacterium]